MTFLEISKTMVELIEKGHKNFELEIKMGALAFNDLLTEQCARITYHSGGAAESKDDKIIYKGVKKAILVQDFDLNPHEVQVFMIEKIVTQIK